MNDLNIPIILHPPNVDRFRAFCKGATQVEIPKPYLDRNKDIVKSCDLLIAFPNSKEEQIRSGTWSTMRFAKKIKRKMIIIFPDGSKEEY
jgi:hypothetical protein